MADNYFGITDPGKARGNNEDTFIAQPVLKNRFIAACVIDGVGGYEGGEVAAGLAHDAIADYLNGNENASIIVLLMAAVAAANEAIYKQKLISRRYEQMACVLTLALADIINNKIYYAHVGDTRLYLLRDNSLVKITHDHSFVGFLEDTGRLSEEAAMRHPKRNEIDKALGFDIDVQSADYIETGESPFLPGDTILLCSDGLTDMINNSAIKSIVNTNKSLSIKGKALINAANNAGGKDNITVVLVHNNKAPLKYAATKPATPAKEKIADNNNNNKDFSKVNKMSDELPVKKNDKKKDSIKPFFVFLGVLILAALVWLIYQNYNNARLHDQEPQNEITQKKRNDQEQLLLDSINATKTNEVFILNQPDAPAIVITDSIYINKDSLHIIGNGVTLISVRSYKGAALTLSPNCKYILLDSMTLENFDIGILTKNTGLHLKSVHFKNCKTAVQQNFMFSDTAVVTGAFADTLFYNADVNF